jgi:hypothetical protein
MMSAEALAKVMRDLRRGRILHGELDLPHVDLVASNSELVDITVIYDGWIDSDKPWSLYEDSVCRPPLEMAAYGWVNRHGNSNVCLATTIDPTFEQWEDLRWDTKADHVFDWSAVRWVTVLSFFCGGWTNTKQMHLPTFGPLATVKLGIDADGTILDARWTISRNTAYTLQDLTFEISIVTQAITLLNCRNVEVLPPVRPKAERKRIERTGVRVSEIHILPAGAWRRKVGGREPVRLGSSTPYGTVRGHVAKYGPEYGRGMLFGKYEGEFWIPQHVRGAAEAGVVEHSYEIE